MPMSNAERQRKFRAEKRKAGLMKKEIWTNRHGLLSYTEKKLVSSMTSKELKTEVEKLFPRTGVREVAYAEMFSYIKSKAAFLNEQFKAEVWD